MLGELKEEIEQVYSEKEVGEWYMGGWIEQDVLRMMYEYRGVIILNLCLREVIKQVYSEKDAGK